MHCSWEEVVLAPANDAVKATVIIATAHLCHVEERAIAVRWEGEKDEKWEYPSVSVHYRFNTDLVMQCVSLMYPCMIRE